MNWHVLIREKVCPRLVHNHFVFVWKGRHQERAQENSRPPVRGLNNKAVVLITFQPGASVYNGRFGDVIKVLCPYK